VLVLPAVDVRGGRCVRLIRGAADDERVYGDDPATAARRWEAAGASLIHVVDLDGAFAGAPANAGAILDIIAAVRIAVEVGGGVRDIASIERWLAGGAARVVLGTAAQARRDVLVEACRRFGERIAVAVDARGGEVQTEGWVRGTGTAATVAAARAVEAGAGRIIYTDIGRDGMLAGPNIAAIEQLLAKVAVPVIASGGIASVDDVRQLRRLEKAGLEGVIVGRALYEGRVRLQDLLSAAA
jgi:phosphoribosylformimino-5-aminoimidazole carboxamide ribotide isomerase